jgi:hypothetical protein
MLDVQTSNPDLWGDDRWFVYLLAATDCSAFKVGFTCNPLQRLYSFSHRYFEHFDLATSRLVPVESNLDARELESTIKHELAPQRRECPSWVLPQAGGETEWFSPIYFTDAQAHLRSHAVSQDSTDILNFEDFVREALERARPYFESWALVQAHSIRRPRPPREQALAAEELRTLRDWLDAYRALNVEIFADNLDARIFLAQVTARSRV